MKEMYVKKLNAKEDVNAELHATFGPETEKGFPVDLKVHVRLNHRKEDGWRLSISCDMIIKACEKLGLIPINAGGQCLDDAVEYLDRCGLVCPTLSKIVPIWKEWHLNDTHSGTPKQEACIDAYLEAHPDRKYDYDDICKMLKRRGLFEDVSYLVSGEPYRYGSSHLFRQIPHEILLELCGLCDSGLIIYGK